MLKLNSSLILMIIIFINTTVACGHNHEICDSTKEIKCKSDASICISYCHANFCGPDGCGGYCNPPGLCPGSNTCIPGSQRECRCLSGRIGVQICKENGSGYSACNGCFDICSRWESRSCICSNGGKGTQTCKSDSTGFDECIDCYGCNPGYSQICARPDGNPGIQYCKNNGIDFEQCRVCYLGDQRTCECPNGYGISACTIDGRFGACEHCVGWSCSADSRTCQCLLSLTPSSTRCPMRLDCCWYVNSTNQCTCFSSVDILCQRFGMQTGAMRVNACPI